VPLRLGQVPDQTEERQRGRLDRATGQRGGIQAGTLQLQRLALPAQEPGERLALGGAQRRHGTRIDAVRTHGHVGKMYRVRVIGIPVASLESAARSDSTG
jgi:hypothetical protein